jgi:hypothetical protein
VVALVVFLVLVNVAQPESFLDAGRLLDVADVVSRISRTMQRGSRQEGLLS